MLRKANIYISINDYDFIVRNKKEINNKVFNVQSNSNEIKMHGQVYILLNYVKEYDIFSRKTQISTVWI